MMPHNRTSSDSPAGVTVPPEESYKRSPLLFYIALPIALFFAAVAWSPPYFLTSIAEWMTSWQKGLFSVACHQQPDRSYMINGVPLAVCTRCIGIYSGFLAGLVFFSVIFSFVKRHNPYFTRIFMIVSIVLVLDGFANLLDIWQTSNHARSIIGLFWGAATGSVLVAALTVRHKRH